METDDRIHPEMTDLSLRPDNILSVTAMQTVVVRNVCRKHKLVCTSACGNAEVLDVPIQDNLHLLMKNKMVLI